MDTSDIKYSAILGNSCIEMKDAYNVLSIGCNNSVGTSYNNCLLIGDNLYATDNNQILIFFDKELAKRTLESIPKQNDSYNTLIYDREHNNITYGIKNLCNSGSHDNIIIGSNNIINQNCTGCLIIGNNLQVCSDHQSLISIDSKFIKETIHSIIFK